MRKQQFIVKSLATALIYLLVQSNVSAQQLYELSETSQDSTTQRPIRSNLSLANQLVSGTTVELELPSGKVVSGTVRDTTTSEGRQIKTGLLETTRIPVSLENAQGSLQYLITNNTITGIILQEAQTGKFYRADFDSNGQGVFKQEDANEYVCVDFPAEPHKEARVAQSQAELEAIPDLAALRNLQSKPGASKTLYIDYWGGTIAGTAWNDTYTSGNPINYSVYDTNGNLAEFTSAERDVMWLGWREAVEDYAAYDVNVTTSAAIYNGTPVTNRSRIIATTTDAWYPNNAGGVAYVGVFGIANDYYKTGWAWNSSAGSLGMTISHEAGHQMGLGHDGTSALGYYGGHGVWGPIMGAPFWQEYVQWSKGEYPDANNFEDDLVIIGNVLGVDADDAGNSNATATSLPVPVDDFEGHVTQDGLFGDVDVYSFSLASTRLVHLEVKILLADEEENRAANLAMNVRLKAGATVIASISSDDNTPLAPETNSLEYDGTLTAGIYQIEIDAVSPDTNWTTGFGEYGNGGEYRISLSSEPPIPDIEVPGPLDFGEVCMNSSKNKVMNVCNTGTGDLSINSIASSQPQFGVTTPLGGYPVNVLPGACFPFQAWFNPVNPGSQTAQLIIASNDPDEATVNVNVNGIGTQQDIEVTGSTDFGTVSAWSSGEQDIKICNIGKCDLLVSSATIDCADFIIANNTLPTTIIPGSCQDMTLKFTPILPGPKSCMLTINSDDLDSPTVERTLTARTPPAFSIHTGVSNSKGSLNNTNDNGLTFNLDYVQDINENWAWDIRAGISKLDGKSTNPDIDVWNVSGNARYTFNPADPIRLFANAGLGLYQFDPGDLEFGGNLGLGLRFPLNPRFSLETTYNYHNAFTASPDLKYDQIQLGVLISF